jgi:hypothetical protein
VCSVDAGIGLIVISGRGVLAVLVGAIVIRPR